MTPVEGPHSDDATLDGLSVEGRRLLAGVESNLFGRTQEVGLGRFVLLDVLGRGGMGVVYRAYDPKLDRRVAVKVMSSADEEARARMLREAQLLAQLSHPNVVAIHEVGEERGEVFVAMEFVDGGTLLAWCERHVGTGRARDRRLLALCHQAIDGLCAAHALGIVHRDIKPANLLVGTDGRLRVADFGLARAGASISARMMSQTTTRDGSDLTQTGVAVGTPAYMPPEQFEGKADARSDQFSFCASFFEVWSGERPFRGSSVSELLDAIEQGQIAEPRRRAIPAYVASVLRRGLRPRSADRFEDMRALGDALRRGERRRVFGAVGLGGVLVAGSITVAVTPRAVAPCTDERARVDEVLSPSRREAIATALQDSGVPFIEEVVQRADISLDRLADDWAEQRMQACQHARAPEPEQATRGRRSQACLDDALERIDESLGSIDTLSPDAARFFPDYLGVLSDIADCRDPSAETIDDELGRELAAVLQRGELADVAFDSPRAREAYEKVLARTEPQQQPRLRARAHIGLSLLDDEAEKPESARRHAIASLDEAQASRDPERIVRAWLNLAELQSDEVPWDTMDVLLGRARRLDEAGALSEGSAVRLRLTEAKIRLRHNQPTEAARLLRAGIERAEPIGHRALTEMYFVLSMIGMVEGDLDAALADSQRALEISEARYGPRHPSGANIRYRLANVQGFRGDIDEAERTIDPAIEILESSPEYRPTNLIKIYSMRGDIRRNLRRFDEAAEDYERGIALALKTGGPEHPELSTLHGSIAEMRSMQERYDDALASVDTAIKLFEGSSMYKRGALANMLILRAGILADLERFAEAVQQLEAAIPVVENAFPSDSTPHIQATFGMAMIWLDVGENTRALDTVAEYFDGETVLDPIWRGRMQSIRARAFEALGDEAEAMRWARLALEAYEGSDLSEDRKTMEQLLARLEGGEAD